MSRFFYLSFSYNILIVSGLFRRISLRAINMLPMGILLNTHLHKNLNSLNNYRYKRLNLQSVMLWLLIILKGYLRIYFIFHPHHS